jgi:threonylcarbamoyladenosine tRNA methylthiotransferase MtaB
VFPYSRREGTPAARVAGQLPMAVKKDRVRRMEETAEERARAIREKMVGKTEDVLFETETNGISDGLTGGYFRVYTDAPVKLGEIAPMRLTRLHEDGFWAEME